MKQAWITLTLLLSVSPIYADTIEVEGLLVVTDCRGADYQQISETPGDQAMLEIAAGCARLGVPMAVFKDAGPNGTLYTLVSPSPILADHIGMRVRLSGEEIAPRVIIPERLEVRTADGWEEVATTTMM